MSANLYDLRGLMLKMKKPAQMVRVFVSSIPEIGSCIGCKISIYHGVGMFKKCNVNNC